MFKVLLLAACAAAPLCGCMTTEEMAARDDTECHSYGAATGTDAYYQCRMTKSQQHIAAQQAAAAQFSHGLDMMAAATAAPPVQTVVTAPAY
jgi:hypothetical protein